MDFSSWFDAVGEPGTIAMGAALIGLVFGAAAQLSRFCLRSAVIDVTGTAGGEARWQRLSLWLIVLGAAMAATQWLVTSGFAEFENVRQLTSARSLSGVLIGGLLFGVGAVLTRGCVSRLTVLSATGNLRAIVALGIFATVAYATFDGPLTPLRQSILGLWTLGGGADLNLLSLAGTTAATGIITGLALTLVALAVGFAVGLGFFHILLGILLGATIAAGWWFTFSLSGQVFEPIAVESISFTRPAIDTVVFGASGFDTTALGFGVGILGGVLAGSFAAALFTGGLKLEWFSSLGHAARFASGAALMGFGGVLAGGCSVGAGLTGGSLFALTSLLALAAMCFGMAVTDLGLARFTSGPAIKGAQAVPAE